MTRPTADAVRASDVTCWVASGALNISTRIDSLEEEPANVAATLERVGFCAGPTSRRVRASPSSTSARTRAGSTDGGWLLQPSARIALTTAALAPRPPRHGERLEGLRSHRVASMLPRVFAPRAKKMVKDVVINTWSLARSTSTSRDVLLALAEIGRRASGDAAASLASASLTPYELRVFSQNGEDGVIDEIIRRSGAPGRRFVEFGAGAGSENNCALLADVFGWSGVFIEPHPASFHRLARKYVTREDVKTIQSFVTPANVQELFEAHGVPPEPDVLSIDVDGSDYWIWQSIEAFRPRIVVIEYNSALGADRRLVQPLTQDSWDRTTYYGASIAAFRELGRSKGYRLVHTDLTGTNAFFVRDDLEGDYPAADLVPVRGPNQFLLAGGHPDDPLRREFVDLDAAAPGEGA